MKFSGQEYWNGLPFLSLGDIPDPEMELASPALQADSSPSEPPGKPVTGETGLLSLKRGARLEDSGCCKFSTITAKLCVLGHIANPLCASAAPSTNRLDLTAPGGPPLASNGLSPFFK